jgi:hypothetical protein
MTEFGGVEATSGTAAAAASLLKSRLEYTGFTSLSLPTYHAARRRAILTSISPPAPSPEVPLLW